jgi:hypothetical protein
MFLFFLVRDTSSGKGTILLGVDAASDVCRLIAIRMAEQNLVGGKRTRSVNVVASLAHDNSSLE